MTDPAPGSTLSRLLIDDWQRILRRAWSIRLLAASFVLDGLETAIHIADAWHVKPPIPAGTFACLAGVVTVAAGVARFVAQRKD